MAEDLVLSALDNLKSLYEDEANLIQVVNQERMKLQSKLSTIQSVIQDAERKQLANRSDVLNNWLLKLKYAVYELDDILDECKTEDIRDEYECNRSCAFLRSFHPQKVMFRHNIIGRMKAIRERLDEIAQEMEQFNFLTAERQPETNLGNIPQWRQTTSLVTEDELFGREQDKQIIIDHLLEDAENADTLYVHPIVGLGGLGKTTLAQLVYGDQRVTKHFQEKKWICVSDNFDLKTLLKAITKSEESDDLNELVEKLQGMLQGKKYLVVFDDVWNDDPEKWIKLRNLLACGAKGSAVLVTTRLEKVAMMMRTPSTQSYHLTALSEDDCWQVFRKRAFGPCIVQETENIVSIGKDIARKCRGVPLAAKTLGGLLMFETEERFWVKVRDSELWSLPEEEGSIFAALRLSYLNLPPRYRRCFSFCSIFPKDHRISKMDLIHLWMANDIISEGQSTTMELEDIGEMVINDFYWRSLIQDVKRDYVSGSICSFKMHDFVHDLAQSVSSHEINAVEKPNSTDMLPGTRHLSIACNVSELRNTFNLLEKVESLRSLVFLPSFYPVDLLISHSLKHTRLRALDWSGLYITLKKFPSSINVLRHLRYLSVSGAGISELPDSIGDLWNLQTLDVSRCHRLERFPVSIGRLRNLMHLYIEGCQFLSSMPRSMVGLTSLRRLSFVVVGKHEKKEFQLSSMRHWKYLRGHLELQWLERVTDAEDAENANLKEKQDLHELYLQWYDRISSGVVDQQKQIQILEALRPSPRLRLLKLDGYQGTGFSNWLMNELSSFRYIESLDLSRCHYCTLFPPLWRLPLLKKLELFELRSIRYLIESYENNCGEEFISFPKLESLSIQSLLMFEKVMSVEKADQQFNNWMIFPRLSKLVIKNFSALNYFNSGPLPSLRSLEFHGSWGRVLPMFTSVSYNLQSLHSLKTLDICHCDFLESLTDKMFQGMSLLRQLYIWSCPKLKSLQSIKCLCSLEVLTLSYCPEVEDISVILHLTSLREFRLWDWYLESLDTDTVTDVPSLKCLSLRNCPSLESLPNWMIGLVSLEILDITRCPLLTTLPDGIQKLPKLKNLYISSCPGLKGPCEKETGQDWHKIAHIPHIII